MKARGFGDDRVLTFEIAGAAYAIPIRGVVEVAELRGWACVPTLASEIGGVVNHHGDALPLVDPGVLLDGESASGAAAGHAIVVSERPDTPGCLALPVQRVCGLASHSTPAARPGVLVTERCAIDGRVTSVLEPVELVARAAAAIDRSAGMPPATRGGDG